MDEITIIIINSHTKWRNLSLNSGHDVRLNKFNVFGSWTIACDYCIFLTRLLHFFLSSCLLDINSPLKVNKWKFRSSNTDHCIYNAMSYQQRYIRLQRRLLYFFNMCIQILNNLVFKTKKQCVVFQVSLAHFIKLNLFPFFGFTFFFFVVEVFTIWFLQFLHWMLLFL